MLAFLWKLIYFYYYHELGLFWALLAMKFFMHFIFFLFYFCCHWLSFKLSLHFYLLGSLSLQLLHLLVEGLVFFLSQLIYCWKETFKVLVTTIFLNLDFMQRFAWLKLNFSWTNNWKINHQPLMTPDLPTLIFLPTFYASNY